MCRFALVVTDATCSPDGTDSVMLILEPGCTSTAELQAPFATAVTGVPLTVKLYCPENAFEVLQTLTLPVAGAFVTNTCVSALADTVTFTFAVAGVTLTSADGGTAVAPTNIQFALLFSVIVHVPFPDSRPAAEHELPATVTGVGTPACIAVNEKF
jgi:hypothetical protein